MSITPRSVVMISPSFFPYVGGAEKQALELSKTLKNAGIRVQVLTRRLRGLPAAETVETVPVSRLCAPGGGFFNSVAFMISCFVWLVRHASEYSAIHVHLAGSPALAAAAAGRLLGKRVIVKLGGGRGIGEIGASSRTAAGRLKLKMLAQLKPQLVAVVDDLVAELREHGLGGAPVVVIPNGVDTARYRPETEEKKRSFRKELRVPEGMCFLYVGRLSEEKQLPLFFEVFAEAIRESRKDGTLILVGQGPAEAALREKAIALNLQERVRFEPQCETIGSYYGAADVFVLPSISEGLSNALLEAMASGLGILGSRVGGTKDAIADGANGLLFDAQSRAQLKEKLLRFLIEPGLCRELGRQARRAAAERYDIGVVAKRYIELYNF